MVTAMGNRWFVQPFVSSTAEAAGVHIGIHLQHTDGGSGPTTAGAEKCNIFRQVRLTSEKTTSSPILGPSHDVRNWRKKSVTSLVIK
jgi:hypothetical protein